MEKDWTSKAVAHELGHMIAELPDLYPPYDGNPTMHNPDKPDPDNLMYGGKRLRSDQWYELNPN